MANCRWGPTEIPTEGQKKYRGIRGTGTLPPEVHFQVSKKIAQLTKVIYTLNGRLDEQESVTESLKTSYEEKLQKLLNETRIKITQYKSKANAASELQELKNQLETRLLEETKLNEQLQESLKSANEETVKLKNGEQAIYCSSCCGLPNGVYLKKLKKEFDFVKPSRKKEEELEIIERILRKKSNGRRSDQPGESPTTNRKHSVVDIPEKDTESPLPSNGDSKSDRTQEPRNPDYLETDFLTGITKTDDFRGNTKVDDQKCDKRFVPRRTRSFECEASSERLKACSPPRSDRTVGDGSAGLDDGKVSAQRLCPGTESTSCDKSAVERREKDLQARIAENQKENLRLQVELKKMERAISRKDEEIALIRRKPWCQKLHRETQTEASSLDDVTDKARQVEDSLKTTLSELQAVSSAFRQTKDELSRSQCELSASISMRRLTNISSSVNNVSVNEIQTQTENSELPSPDDDDVIERSRFQNQQASTELKGKVSELLQQVTLMMTNSDLCGTGNMSDAEKENTELRRILKEKEARFRLTILSKDEEKNALAKTIEDKERHFEELREKMYEEHRLSLESQSLSHQREISEIVKNSEEMYASKIEALQKERDQQLQKLEEEVSEMSRRLQSQTELQTAEMARLNHELTEALNASEKKEEDIVLLEMKLTKSLEKSKNEERLEHALRQNEVLLKQLDQKRDEVLQVRREAMQQIRNLENYWLEKVNQELTRIRKNYGDEKKTMIESFSKSQRLLKDKILALQKPSEGQSSRVDGPGPSQKELKRNRRYSTMSHIEFNNEVDEDLTCEALDDRIFASQPNVAYFQPENNMSKKERMLSEQRFIKRAESVLLPKLQFLSFWKSASNLDKVHAHSKKKTRSPPRRDERSPHGKVEVNSASKRFKMSPTFHIRGSPGYSVTGLQESRSNSCFNLSCRIGNPEISCDAFATSSLQDPQGVQHCGAIHKRHSFQGSARCLGVVPEARSEEHKDSDSSDDESSDSLCLEPQKDQSVLESEL